MDEDIARWDRIAEEYSRHIDTGDVLREHLLNKEVFSLVGDVRDAQLLDAGCGEGYLSRAFCDAGARVHGIDVSSRFIRLAQDKSAGRAIQFTTHNLTQPLSFPDHSFDIIISQMVLMDFDPIDTALREFSRVLTPRGVFVFSILHPLFSSGTFERSLAGRIFRTVPYCKISSYAVPTRRLWRVAECLHETAVYHRPLHFYTSLLRTSGFSILDISEPTLDARFARDKGCFFKLCAVVPPFLVVRASRTPTVSCVSSARR